MLASICYKKGMDLSVYISYYRKSERLYVVDKPFKISELFEEGLSREEMAKKLCDRCNELGKMEISVPNEEKEKATKIS